MLPEGRTPLTLLARNEDADVALFEQPPGTDAPPLPCAIGDSDALRLGTPLILVERDPVAGPLIRAASVAALRGTERSSTLSPSEQSFMVTLGLVAGESGSPLLLREDRSCALVGVALGTHVGPRQLSWGIRIREAMEALALGSDPSPPSAFLRNICEAAIKPDEFSFCEVG